MKTIYVTDIEPGMEFESLFTVRKMELREYSGKYYLVLDLGDRTGRIRATYWGSYASKLANSIEKSDVVRVNAMGIIFKNEVELKIETLKTIPKGDYDDTDFLPISTPPPEELFKEYGKWVKTIENEHLFAIFKELFKDKEFKEKFIAAPAGKLWHHTYLGGLLKHTLGVTAICDRASTLYPDIHRDLLITGALLHDIGKVYEFEWSTYIDYSVQGRLVGHIVIGERIVKDAIGKIKEFPDELATKVSHMILSHQGEKAYGSPVVPMMLEAVILYFADQMDSQSAAFTRIMEKEKDGKKVWSDWVKLIDRYIYLK
ncbi:HD domain-containing protein [bacterium]|nr:HD domain-containing protein [bacterium]